MKKHHYVAFVHNSERGEWLLLDDDKAIPVRKKEACHFVLSGASLGGRLLTRNVVLLGVRFLRLSGLRHFDVSRRPGVDGGDANIGMFRCCRPPGRKEEPFII